jgi:hypothetical protein
MNLRAVGTCIFGIALDLAVGVITWAILAAGTYAARSAERK